ncbi:hypothetical protein AUC45_12870 [Erythrobacter sp. YT30]|nr:hypothetical protein AUC45_12870 [Erythrobacter sp. YT30]
MYRFYLCERTRNRQGECKHRQSQTVRNADDAEGRGGAISVDCTLHSGLRAFLILECRQFETAARWINNYF